MMQKIFYNYLLGPSPKDTFCRPCQSIFVYVQALSNECPGSGSDGHMSGRFIPSLCFPFGADPFCLFRPSVHMEGIWLHLLSQTPVSVLDRCTALLQTDWSITTCRYMRPELKPLNCRWWWLIVKLRLSPKPWCKV